MAEIAEDTDGSSLSSTNDDIITKILHLRNKSNIVNNSFINRITPSRNFIPKLKNLSMNINYEKEFKSHLQKKLQKLETRLNVLQMKYNGYKKWYDRINIMIIIISSLLSIFEALRNELNDTIEKGTFIYIYFNLMPIFISCIITCSAAIVKFKKYQEKMENMQFTREKVIMAFSKIKHIQESLWFITDKEFDSIKHKYMTDVYMIYNESNSELERQIKTEDYYKYYKKNKKFKKKHTNI